MKRSPYHIAQERLNQYIQENGMRASSVRDFVLEQLCTLHQPFTAEQLIEACSSERISTGTVYNSLNLFLLARILHVIKRQRGRTAMEYELTIGNSVHIQKMCLKCGRVTDFTDQAISRFIKEKRFSNFNLNHFSLVLYGECKTCRGKTGEERKKEENNTQKQ